MMRCDSFARAAAFAALAAAGWLVWVVGAGPWLGARAALSSYLVAVTAAYTFALVPSRRRRLIAALAAAAAGAIATACASTITQLAIALAAMIGIARCVTCDRLPRSRAIAAELVLGGAGLLFARALAGSTLLSLAVALWAYLLVHSFFFLIGGVRPRTPDAQPDPFEAAYRRAVGLLDLE